MQAGLEPAPSEPRARRRVHRLQRRRPPRSLRRERRGSEPALRERAVARRREGRSRRARLPLRGARRGAKASPIRSPAWASPHDGDGRRPLRHELARTSRRPRSDQRRGSPASRTRGRPSTPRSAAPSPAGARPGSTSRTPATRPSCSPRARSRSRACASDAEPVRVLGPRRRRALRQRAPERSARAACAERARPRRGRRRQRRPHGHRDQHDRRQARAPAPDTGPSGHWLDVKLARFSPGAVVTAVLPDGRRLGREVQAGSSYLSSEDPRVHFGLGDGDARQPADRALPVGRRDARCHDVRADRIVEVSAPRAAHASAAAAPRCARGCTRGEPARPARSRRSGTRRRVRRAARGRRDGAGAGARPLRPVEAMRHCRRVLDRREREPARRGDQLRVVPAARLARVVRREPEPDVRAPDATAALALLLAGLHEHDGRLAGGARQPHRRRCDRSPAATTARSRRSTTSTRATSPMNAPLVVSAARLDRPRPDVLAAARARADRRARARRDSREDPELRRRAVGSRARLRVAAVGEGLPIDPGAAALRRPVGARRTSRPPSR